jgi:hypothetical protein
VAVPEQQYGLLPSAPSRRRCASTEDHRVMTPLPSPVQALLRSSACLLAVGALALGASACGGTSAAQQRLQDEQTAHAIATAKRQARTQERIRQARKEATRIRRELANAKKQAAAGTAAAAGGAVSAAATGVAGAVTSSAGRSCGAGVTANSVTSCPFALRVKAAYTNQGGPSVQVYSPVTQRTYTMTCSPSGAQVTCRGGDNAVVTF